MHEVRVTHRSTSATATVVFLEKLEKSEPLSASLLDEMNKQYAFDSTGSTEVRLRWYNLALKPKSGGNYASSAAEWVRQDLAAFLLVLLYS